MVRKQTTNLTKNLKVKSIKQTFFLDIYQRDPISKLFRAFCTLFPQLYLIFSDGSYLNLSHSQARMSRT